MMNNNDMKKRIAVGIDLGTTNSCVAYMNGKDAVVLQNDEGRSITPSCVSFSMDENGGLVTFIGDMSLRQALTNAKNTVYVFKRLMGKNFNAVSDIAKSVNYDIVADENGDAVVSVFGQQRSPVFISGVFLQKLVEEVSRHGGYEIKEVVITVPANFDDTQRNATKAAGTIAKLDVLRIISEPTAAAMAYAAKHPDLTGKVLVYDLGGGTFDVSVVDVSDGFFQVKATDGDMNLGGEDFDKIIVDWVVSEFKKTKKILITDVTTLHRIRLEAKRAKEALSAAVSTQINVPYVNMGVGVEPEHILLTITRSWFEDQIRHHINRTIEIARGVLATGQWTAKDITRGVLVGGSTRIKCVKEMLEKELKIQFYDDVNPDTAIAEGAALQASILTGKTEGIILVDVTPLDVGIATVGNLMSVIIPRNTAIPCEQSQMFTTAADNQDQVLIEVYQGNRSMVTDNKFLGKFSLTNIKPAPRGTPRIHVTFKMDANGILNVSAKEEISGVSHNINITNMSNKKDDAEISRMMKEAEEQKARDAELRTKTEAKIECDNMIYEIEKSIAKIEDADADKKTEFQNKLNDIRNTLESDPITAKDNLRNLAVEISGYLSSKQPTNENNNPQSSDDQDSK